MLQLEIAPNGDIKFIYNDSLASLLTEGEATVTRASHVEPDPRGGWTADMSPVGGPVLGSDKPFTLRQEALDAEVEWLKENIF